ncbi:hypothetical protein GGR30_002586 [Martelella radicis]|uniref:Uncharacterized protein n=1 Tax=Martelella radicis TaxID=1397476 RepID=A0A7W6PBQ2_9HYPH|nr:hypothetical protein [Martelella radicis]
MHLILFLSDESGLASIKKRYISVFSLHPWFDDCVNIVLVRPK